MIISSNRAGAVGGLDLWVSTRSSAQDAWSTPINLNQDNLDKCAAARQSICPVVNTTANDSAPALSWDGQTLIFFSNRTGGHGSNDLWTSTRAKLCAWRRDQDEADHLPLVGGQLPNREDPRLENQTGNRCN
jgi:hypothetical protein